MENFINHIFLGNQLTIRYTSVKPLGKVVYDREREKNMEVILHKRSLQADLYVCYTNGGKSVRDLPILLKWPGGKRALLKQLMPFAPKTFHRYYEPFVGSGAMFFALEPSKAILSDANEELINCYAQVRDKPEEVIDNLANMKNTREDYYNVRASAPTEQIARAARFIYLMTLSFNGIHRVNLQGKFNVPYNHKTHLNLCDKDKILRSSIALSATQITHCDFEAAVEKANCGDFIYFDPPYAVSYGQCGFVRYNEKVFSWRDQIRLAKTAHSLAARGCYILVSNANHPSILKLYQSFGFHTQYITRFSAIAAKSKHRCQISECLFYNEQRRSY